MANVINMLCGGTRLEHLEQRRNDVLVHRDLAFGGSKIV
jgi:hypothetical protein